METASGLFARCAAESAADARSCIKTSSRSAGADSPLTTACSRSSRACSSRSCHSSGRRTLRIQRRPSPIADHAHHATHPLVERSRPDRRGAAIAGAVEAEVGGVDPRPGPEISERGLHVGDAAEGRKPGARPLARAPALVVEGEHHVARLRQHPRVVGQVEALHAGVAVAEHDAGAQLVGVRTLGPIEIALEAGALAVEAHAFALHGGCLMSRHRRDVHENLSIQKVLSLPAVPRAARNACSRPQSSWGAQ